MANGSSNDDLRRLHTHDIEIGISEALERHISRHVIRPPAVTQRRLDFEHKRPRLYAHKIESENLIFSTDKYTSLRECMAEATGVFFYVFPGIAAVAFFTVNTTGPLPVPFFSNILQIGFAFAMGIVFAITIFAPVSGGHFNPAITICFAIWQGFPWKKVPHYIFSQIFGAFVAGMVLMGAFWPEISALKAASIAKEGTAVFNGGPASILCVFPNPNQTNHGFLFFQEFFVDSFIGIVICTFLPSQRKPNKTKLSRSASIY